METPRTLQAAIEFFADPDRAHSYMVAKRWPNGVACPTCGELEPRFIATRRLFECKSKHERRQFSVKVGTIFEDSPIALKSWLLAVWMVANCKNGVSSYEVARAIGVTQKSAWFMLHRIRLAMQSPDGGKFNGNVEVDETYIGGKARNQMRNLPKYRREKASANRKGRVQGLWGKTLVQGLLERKAGEKSSRVRTVVVATNRKTDLLPTVFRNVSEGANVYTDALKSYRVLSESFVHQFVDHAETYVNGSVHTNGIENYWALLKRMLKGTYISVEPFHLFRYLDEQSFRFNERTMNDGQRFDATLKAVTGRRLTYEQLTGREVAA
jgi:transposase-like protein